MTAKDLKHIFEFATNKYLDHLLLQSNKWTLKKPSRSRVLSQRRSARQRGKTLTWLKRGGTASRGTKATRGREERLKDDLCCELHSINDEENIHEYVKELQQVTWYTEVRR